jgi:hypothetical protein
MLTESRRKIKMGLDISLIRIIDREVDEYSWLIVEDSPELLPLFSHLVRVKHFKFPDEEYDEEVFFFEEISYQRKAMKRAFYDEFENDKCLTDKTEVEKMWHYVIEEQKESFKEHFVDKFNDGETAVTISW